MKVVEQTVILQLEPQEYDDWVPFLDAFIKDKSDQGFERTSKRKPRFQFDANYDLYYVKLKFNRYV